jgi:predicted PurR-regulated permease PerM
MVTLSRILTISITSYSLNGNLIPYNTWWGILIWAVIIIATLIITIFIYKRGDKIERKITSFFKNKFKGKKSEQS